MARATFKIWRGQGADAAFEDYSTEVAEGMVVLDAMHHIQAESAPDLAVRWNCKAGKCGSCSAEVNGSPRLMCMTRLSDLPLAAWGLVWSIAAFVLPLLALLRQAEGRPLPKDWVAPIRPSKDLWNGFTRL